MERTDAQQAGQGPTSEPPRASTERQRPARRPASASSTDRSRSSTRSRAARAPSPRSSRRPASPARPPTGCSVRSRITGSCSRSAGAATRSGRGCSVSPPTAMRELPLRDLARPALERLARLDRRERAALRPRRRAARVRRRGRVRPRAPHDRRDRRRAPPHEGLGRQGLPRVGRRRTGWRSTSGSRASSTRRRAGVGRQHRRARGGRRLGERAGVRAGCGLLAAVSVSGPASRVGALRAKRYASAVVEAAREIEHAMGA